MGNKNNRIKIWPTLAFDSKLKAKYKVEFIGIFFIVMKTMIKTF
jgi:hypothetical protein